MTEINQLIDHTLLKPEIQERDILRLCSEAIEYSFFAVCVNPCFVPLAAKELKGSSVKIATVCGFPLGASTTESKRFEAHESITLGAHEVDMVISIGALKERRLDYIRHDIQSVKSVCSSAVLKVILETCLLTEEEIAIGCNLSKEAGADFVKTSTGFSTGGATLDAVRLMRNQVGDIMGVKASGGIRNLADAEAMVQAGATRLGTSSGVALVKEFKARLAGR